MTFRQRLEEIAKQKEQIHRREAELENERMTALAVLPYHFGYKDLPRFIRAIRRASRIEAGKPVRLSRPKISQPPLTFPGLARSQVKVETNSRPVHLGTSLDDPVNFGQMPDFTLLKHCQAIGPDERSRLTDALAFANRVLHTSRVPAAVWREWRKFEKEATELLRQ